MKECCKYFFEANSLQNILNAPLQCCGYCGHRLSRKEFSVYNNKFSKIASYSDAQYRFTRKLDKMGIYKSKKISYWQEFGRRWHKITVERI